MKAAVSVVIPAYNVEAFIGDALRSLQAQDLTDWQCVVVDDGSTDNTAAVVSSFDDPRIRLISQDNRGVSSARNRGIKEVESDAVLFLDGDDMIHPTALRRLDAALKGSQEAILVFGTTMRMTAEGKTQTGQRPPQDHAFVSGDVHRNMLTHDRVFWNGGQLLVRTSALRRLDGYREDLRLSEDWEFFCRLTSLGPCVFIGPQEEILNHRVHPASAAPVLSIDIENHLPAIDIVFSNPMLASRFGAGSWRRMKSKVIAIHEFEAGRQNYAQRRYREARRLMLSGLLRSPSLRRCILFALTQVSQATGRPIRGVPLLVPKRPTPR